jgi:hypothetical protein
LQRALQRLGLASTHGLQRREGRHVGVPWREVK